MLSTNTVMYPITLSYPNGTLEDVEGGEGGIDGTDGIDGIDGLVPFVESPTRGGQSKLDKKVDCSSGSPYTYCCQADPAESFKITNQQSSPITYE
jgi:hypothetical protein